MKKFAAAVISLLALSAPVASVAVDAETSAGGCINAHVIGTALVNKICWDCVLPIRVAGVPLNGSSANSRVPGGAANQWICACPDNLGVYEVGLPTSFWQPFRLVEFEHVPGCLSALEGVRLPFSRLFLGDTQADGASIHSKGTAFRHYHWYTFPVMILLDMYVPGHCNPGGYHDIDVMYLSEVDPSWSNDAVAFFTNPEAVLVSSAPATVACIADAVASNLGSPIQSLFWCAGSWGNMYPLSGHVDYKMGVIDETSLQTVKVLNALHRRGFEYGTVGNDALCEAKTAMTLPKNQYRLQMFHPSAETDDNHVIGASSLLWGLSRTKPATGEDPIYVVWRWLDCCNH